MTSADGSPVTFTELTPNTPYTFTVMAYNSVGNSSASIASETIITLSVV